MLLSTRSLTFSYGSETVLDTITFDLNPGELVALIGPNGSGKSTLLRCLIGELRGSGDVIWNDKPLGDWRPRELAKYVAFLPQAPLAEPSQSVADVLRLGRSPYLHAFGIESPKDVDIVEKVARELGLADLLDRPIDSLSGGQRQRVFLGRCLVQQPAAILLDEPDSHLDLKHQLDLGQRVQELAHQSNLAILMATHDLNLAARFADRLILLDHGQIAASGPPGEVLDPALISRVYEVPMQRVERPSGPPLIVPAFTDQTAN